MTKVVQMVGGPTSSMGVYPGRARQITVNTDTWSIRVHDGVTPGGFSACMSQLNLSDLADAAVARNNLGAAPINTPNFLGGAQVDGAQILTNGGPLGVPASGDLGNCTGYDVTDLDGVTPSVMTMLSQASTGTTGLVGKLNPTIANPIFTGQVGVNGAPVGSYEIACSGAGGIYSSAPMFSAGYVAAPAGFGVFQSLGFGLVTNFGQGGGIFTNNGGGFDIVCVSNGVRLNNGATSWVGISTREKKKKIQSIPGDPLARIMGLSGYLYLYKTEEDNAPLRTGVMYEDDMQFFPWAAETIPASVRIHEIVDQEGEPTGEILREEVEEFKGTSLEKHVPLLIDGIKALVLELRAARAEIAELKAKINV